MTPAIPALDVDARPAPALELAPVEVAGTVGASHPKTASTRSVHVEVMRVTASPPSVDGRPGMIELSGMDA